MEAIAATGAAAWLESAGVLVGQSGQSASVETAELTFTFSRHRIVVLASRDEAWNAANHLAVLHERTDPALTW